MIGMCPMLLGLVILPGAVFALALERQLVDALRSTDPILDRLRRFG